MIALGINKITKHWREVMEDNILSGGINELNQVKASLMRRNELRNEYESLTIEEARLERSIQSKEKAISDEINNTLKKRKDEIEAIYDEQISKIQVRSKRIRNKKKKSKSVKISERIELETIDLKQEYQQMMLDTKSIFKQNKIPHLCNTRIFYALYMPKGVGDLLIILIHLLIILLAIPCGIYFLLLPEEKIIYLFLIYFLIVIVFGSIYKIIENKTVNRFGQVIRQVRKIRNNMANNKRKQNKIKKKILKDKDESSYGLEKFDDELLELDKELSAISIQKKNALTEFESKTKVVISEEIRSRYQEEVDNIKREYDNVYSKIKVNESDSKTLSLEIASKYEAFLGKEFMVPEKIEELSELMIQNNLSKISEAIAEYRGTDE